MVVAEVDSVVAEVVALADLEAEVLVEVVVVEVGSVNKRCLA
jgi:hypothetical protein